MGYNIRSYKADLPVIHGIRNTESEYKKTAEKLSTGKRLNKAMDNPSQVVISERLKSQVAGTEQAIRNTELDISLMQIGESALAEVNTILSKIKQVAVQAANESVYDSTSRKILQTEYNDLLNALDTIVRTTKFGDKKLLGGDLSVTGIASNPFVEFISGGNQMETTEGEGLPLVIEQNATRAYWAAEDELDDEGMEAGVKFKIIEDGKTATYTTKAGDSPENILESLRQQVKIGGLDITIGLENDKLFIYHNKFGSEHNFSVVSNVDGVLSDEAGYPNDAAPGYDAVAYLNGLKLEGRGQYLYGPDNTSMEGLVLKYTGTEGDFFGEEGRRDAGQIIVRNNAAIFQIGQDAEDFSSFSLATLNTSTLGNGVENELGYSSLRDVNLETRGGGSAAILLINDAINNVSLERGKIGSHQKHVLESQLSNLRVTRENLKAANSTIEDADYAEEISKLVRNQIAMAGQFSVLSHSNTLKNKINVLLTER